MVPVPHYKMGGVIGAKVVLTGELDIVTVPEGFGETV
jgi:hypothetical protein